VLHVPTSQYADIFTTGLPTSVFTKFHCSLNVQRAPGGRVRVLNMCEYIVYVCIRTSSILASHRV
jgi:hypothetical protein